MCWLFFYFISLWQVINIPSAQFIVPDINWFFCFKQHLRVQSSSTSLFVRSFRMCVYNSFQAAGGWQFTVYFHPDRNTSNFTMHDRVFLLLRLWPAVLRVEGTILPLCRKTLWEKTHSDHQIALHSVTYCNFSMRSLFCSVV